VPGTCGDAKIKVIFEHVKNCEIKSETKTNENKRGAGGWGWPVSPPFYPYNLPSEREEGVWIRPELRGAPRCWWQTRQDSPPQGG